MWVPVATSHYNPHLAVQDCEGASLVYELIVLSVCEMLEVHIYVYSQYTFIQTNTYTMIYRL